MRTPILLAAAVTIFLAPAALVGQRAHYPPDTLSHELAQAWTRFANGDRDAIRALYESRKGSGPLIEPSGNPAELLVTFLWMGDESTEKVDLDGGLPAARSYPWNKDMFRLGDSNLWYRTESIPSDARFQYGFYVNVPYLEFVSEQELMTQFAAEHPTLPDPLNPVRTGSFSLLELPDAPDQPYARFRASVPRGGLHRDSLFSSQLSEQRRFTVYLPNEYEDGVSYPVLIVFDGETFGSLESADVPLPTILDNLIADDRIPPTVGVLVDNQGTRRRDLPNNYRFSDFVVEELLPVVRQRYSGSERREDVTVAGFSNGGLAAGFVALTHPESVANVLAIAGWWAHAENDYETRYSQAPDYLYERGWIIREFARRERLPLRFYMTVGRFDHYDVNNLAVNRHMRDVLTAKGYPLRYEEINTGHDRPSVPGMITSGLIALAEDWSR